MTNSSCVCKLDRVRSRCHGCEVESSESLQTAKLAVQTRHVEDDEWRMIQPEAAPCLMFCSPFHISSALPEG